MRSTCNIGLSFVLLLACGREPPPPPPRVDGSVRDAGPYDAGPIPPRRDAGPAAPTLDGVVDDPQWEGAVVVANSVATNRDGSVLQRMSALIAGGQLYLAIEGSLASGDVLLVYVDSELGAGVGVSDFRALLDEEGALDSSLSRVFETPENFAGDVALGTTMMPRTAVGLDDATGWRSIGDSPTEFTWFTAEDAPMVCSAAACEASIELDALPGTEPREIGVFARIAAADGLTNQTLPQGDPSRPDRVGSVLVVSEGDISLDAGVGDAGVALDAGPSVPVVDGIVSLDEWSGALVDTNPLNANGTPFAGNSLSTLRIIRSAERLYVAVEGGLTVDNAILMYVDVDVGGGGGLPTSTSALMDSVGSLDLAFSSKLITLPAELRIDFVWGTLDMSRTSAGIDDRMGWRNVALTPATFVPISSPTACTVSACETSVLLADLGVRAGETLGIFVRLGSSRFDTLSNQTLPMDADPRFAFAFAEVPP